MTEDAQLIRWLGAHRDVVTGGSSTDHLDVDTLSRHATGQLSPGKARLVSEHLLVCDDGRCLAFVRTSAEDVDAAASLLYPAEEAKGMHARTFLCREALWEAFEEMAREQGAPIDNIVSEAMRAYARQRSYGGRAVEEPSAHDYQADGDDELARTGAIRAPTHRMNAPTAERRAVAPNPRPAPSAIQTTRGVAPPPATASVPSARAPLQRPYTAPINQPLPAPPPPPARSGGFRHPSSGGAPLGPPPRAAGSARSMPPPLPPSEPMMPAASSYGRGGRVATQLSLTYQGRSYDVTKDRFLLGRSKSQADLVLDDPNVSRQHAAIERVGDTWVLADLGSTNGCYVEGQRVSRRPIADGDVIEITTHQVICTLR
jgi:hypothetical protein